MVKVSVIIPVYNVEKYIDRCLKSLVNQTFKDYEVIVVNDGSPDNSQKIIDKYTKKYHKLIKSVIKENGGQGSARNLGIELSKGKYVMFVDSDDYIEKTMIEELYSKVEEGYDIVACNNYIEYENGQKLEDIDESIYFNKEKNYLFSKPAVWNKIFLKDIIVKNKIKFREKLWYEDFDFTINIYGLTDKIGFVPKPLYNYIIREGSTMNNSNIQRNLEIILAFDEIIKFYKSKKIYTKYYDYLEFLAIYNIYIATNVRVINAKADKKKKLEVINKINNYMYKNFPDFKNNKYIDEYLSKNKKVILKLMNNKHYSLINIIFKVKNTIRR